MEEALRLDCVVLAAGSGSRLGGHKPFLPFRGSTILGATLSSALAAGLRAIVVLRPGDEEAGLALARSLEGARGGGFRPGCDLEIVVNPATEGGMLGSIQTGAARVRSSRFFFLPADMPFVGPEIYALLSSARTERPVIPTAGGRRGHPVLLPSSMIASILELPPSLALRDLIAASAPVFVETGDPSVLRDIDTREDYAAALAEAEAPAGALTCSPRAAG
jgi:molybdenum cofactor cytidylyltransferase